MDAIRCERCHGWLRSLCAPGCFLLGISLVWLCGCRSNCELVEAELRSKEAQLAELRRELDQRDCLVQHLEREVARLQQMACTPGGCAAASSAVPFVKEIRLGRLTGGYDEDPVLPGDEALQVILEPRDCDGQSVKAPGSLRLEVFEITPQGIKVPLSSWDFSPAELRRSWDTPFLGSPSYRIIVPWKSWPMHEKLRVVARFTTLDGQHFEADKDVSVRLAAQPAVRERIGPPPTEACPGPAGPHLEPPPPMLPPPTPAHSPTTEPSPGPMPPPPEPPQVPWAAPSEPSEKNRFPWERPSEVAPAEYVHPAEPPATRMPSPRARPPALPPVSLDRPVKASWKPLR